VVVGRSWVTTSKHLLLGDRFLISKYRQPLVSNAFANDQVPLETNRVQETVFPALSVPRTSLEVNQL
jgi:hypothetical protein